MLIATVFGCLLSGYLFYKAKKIKQNSYNNSADTNKWNDTFLGFSKTYFTTAIVVGIILFSFVTILKQQRYLILKSLIII